MVWSLTTSNSKTYIGFISILITFTIVILLYNKFNSGVIFLLKIKQQQPEWKFGQGQSFTNETGDYIKEVS